MGSFHLGLKPGCNLGVRLSVSWPLPIESRVDLRLGGGHEHTQPLFSYLTQKLQFVEVNHAQ